MIKVKLFAGFMPASKGEAICRSGTQAVSYRMYCVANGPVDEISVVDTTLRSVTVFSSRVNKGQRLLCLKFLQPATQLDSDGRFTSPTRNASFWRKSFQVLSKRECSVQLHIKI